MSLNLLILTSSTGGGHDMRAAALKGWAQEHKGWNVVVHQALEATHPLYAFGVSLYNTVQRTLPVAHHAYFNFLEHARLHTDADRIMGADTFLSAVDAHQPDLVVSTHAHLNHGFFALIRRHLGADAVRCVTYCGELWGGYGFSRHWVNPDCDGFIGAVEPCVDQAVKLGMAPDKARVGGFLLRPAFYEQLQQAASRDDVLEAELDLDASTTTLLLSTGAVGANNHLALLHCLETRRKPVQAIVLCGNQPSVLRQVQEWGNRAKYTTVRALPRQDDMPRLIRSVDLVVARPGTGTTSEAILCGTPILFNGIGGIMPQEYLTVKFARHAGLGAVIYWPHDLARFLDDQDRHPEKLTTMRDATINARPPHRPEGILDYLENLVRGRS